MKLNAFLIALLLTSQIASAQFIPDANGYISDPKFHQLIKTKGYSLVASFDTLNKKPLQLAAHAVQNGKRVVINTKGVIINRPERIALNGDVGGMDISIRGPNTYQRDDAYQQISINGRYGTINKQTQQEGLKPNYDALSYIGFNLLKTEINGKKGLAKANGIVVLAPVYNEISMLDNSDRKNNPGLFRVNLNGKTGLLSKEGKEVLVPKFDDLSTCFGCDRRGELLITIVDKKQGLATINGQILLPPIYEKIRFIALGLISVSVQTESGMRYGMIDSLGKVLFHPKFAERPEYLREQKLIKLNAGSLTQPKLGLANMAGKLIVEPDYEDLIYFRQQLVVVKKNAKRGVISLKGLVILPPDYNQIYISDHMPLIVADRDNKTGLFDLKGRTLLPMEYDLLVPVNKNSVISNKNGKWGRTNLQTKTTDFFPYDHIEMQRDVMVVRKDGKSGVADLNGKVLFPIQYQKIRNAQNALRDGIIIIEQDRNRYAVDRYGNRTPQGEWY